MHMVYQHHVCVSNIHTFWSKEVVDTALLLKFIVFHLYYVTLSHLQAPVSIVGGVVNGSVLNYTFTYDDGSGSPTFVLPSANCSGDVCEHLFNIPTSNVPPSYNVSVTATNVFGEGPANTSQPICEQMDNRVITSQVGGSIEKLMPYKFRPIARILKRGVTDVYVCMCKDGSFPRKLWKIRCSDIASGAFLNDLVTIKGCCQ